MKDYSVPIQSLIDHINTATDVDPWAKEMAADLLAGPYEKERRTKVEFIESYIKIGDGEYQWNDNHGELIRCKDCRYWIPGEIDDNDNFIPPGCELHGCGWSCNNWCSDGVKKEINP